ncbi:MAG: GIY-YIG nuclease family protein [Candidatus Omnitrophica bacterium]|nr:GIY-YIG nuclease family protein [Candidatus Omnitrophota bacterium]
MDIGKKIENLPLGPGVYIMKDKHSQVLYIGKAASIKKRLKGHFSRPVAKNAVFLNKVTDLECILCQNPEQALILEAALIKERKPKYNIALRDSKSYPYVAVTREKFSRIGISRPKKKGEAVFYGPYPGAKTLKSALGLIRKIFPFRSCLRLPKEACLFYHLKLCPAPCEGKVSLAGYRQNISNITKILSGKRKELIKQLEEKMGRESTLKNFEAAAAIRDILGAINNLYQGKPKEHEIISLKEVLGLDRLPLYIEAIDISSLGSGDSTGSVVVFKDGVPDKDNYRRFLIKQTKAGDDYAGICEVVQRRYSRLLKENKPLPDLVVIDGGQGHVRTAARVFFRLGIKVAVIGLAKGNEEIWFPDKLKPLVIAKNHPCLQLIQRLRDEAHRFAHSYQLLRRRKRMGISK